MMIIYKTMQKAVLKTMAYSIVFPVLIMLSYGGSPSFGDDVPTLLFKLGPDGIGEGQFSGLAGIAVDSKDNVYVTDPVDLKVLKFTSNGEFITMWGSSGVAEGQFSNMGDMGIAVDSKDNVYVADWNLGRIQKFTSNGEFITMWGSSGVAEGQFSGPAGIAVDSKDNVYVTDYWNDRVQKFTSNGEFITMWGSSGVAVGQFSKPYGITVGSLDHVYVADEDNARILKFTSNGEFITMWGSSGVAEGQFSGPAGIAVDSKDNVYVTDWRIDRVQKFTSNGEFISKFNDVEAHQNPIGIAVNGFDIIYVVHRGESAIYVFTYAHASHLITWHVGEVYWVQEVYLPTANGTVRIIDPDMNMNPETIDRFDIDVWSDSDKVGIMLTVVETGENTGIFEGTVVFKTSGDSSSTGLVVGEGDAVFARYTDHTVPETFEQSAIDVIGSTRILSNLIQLTNLGVVDSFANPIEKVYVDDRIMISADVVNLTNSEQAYYFVVQIFDQSGNAVTRPEWNHFSIPPQITYNNARSWTPERPGEYTVNVSVLDHAPDGQNLGNPISMVISVLSAVEENRHPTAIISVIRIESEGERTIFSAERSHSVDGEIVEYLWDFGDGNSKTGKTVSNIYGQAGKYLVTLEVKDDKGVTNIAELYVDIDPKPILPPPVVDDEQDPPPIDNDKSNDDEIIMIVTVGGASGVAAATLGMLTKIPRPVSNPKPPANVTLSVRWKITMGVK